ncbi:MAG: ABC transporter permease [Betaproteobacteria bacterium]|nr:ABC transporter permease [Betaproteobacteria bacterium]
MTENASPAPTASPSSWLLLSMLRRELRDRYAGTSAGLGWALLQPVLMLALYALVFAFIFRVRLTGYDTPLAYITFVAITLWPWFLLQEGLLRAMTALRAQAALVRKTTLRRDLPVTVCILASAMIHLAGYVAVLACLTLAGAELRFDGLPLAVLSVATLLTVVMGLGFLLASIQLVWRDLEHAVQPLFLILFYATPILYPITLVPEEVRPFITANPMAWWVERQRDALLNGALPGAYDIAGLVATAVGCWICRRLYLKVAAFAEDLL